MAKPNISADRLRELVSYDQETGVFVNKVRRGCIRPGALTGKPKPDGYVQLALDGRTYFAHRLAFLYVFGIEPKIIDHINGVRFDNRICNLRSTDYFGNARNSAKSARGNSGASCSRFKGVKKNVVGRYEARIFHAGKSYPLGGFATDVAAAYAYDMKSMELHKEFGRRNFLPLM